MEIALVFLLITSIIINVVFFRVITDNQKHILDNIDELKKK